MERPAILQRALTQPSLRRPTLFPPGEQRPEGLPLGWAMDLVRQDSTFTCTSTRNIGGYNGDPSAANPPLLISVPAGVQAIQGGRWDGSKFLTTTIAGATLNPYITKETGTGIVRIFTEFATYSAVGVIAGEQVAKLTTTGNWVFLTALAPGNAVSVTVTDADIGTDIADAGGFDWRVGGYATLHKGGEVLEDVATNACIDSREFDAASWTDTGLGTNTNNETGIDGGANLAYTLEDDSAAAAEAVLDSVAVLNDSNTHTIALYIKKDADETRFPEVGIFFSGGSAVKSSAQINTKTGATAWRLDTASGVKSVMDLGGWWRLIVSATNDSSGNTLLSYRVYPAAGTILGVQNVAAVGSIIADQADCRLNQSFMDSPIFTSGGTATRAATLLTDTTAGRMLASSWAIEWVGTPLGAGQVNTLFASYVDANNYTAIITTATTVVLRERVGGANTDLTETFTHGVVPIKVQAYHDGTNNGIRAFNVGATPSAWHTAAHSTDSQIGSTFENCSNGNGADGFYANNISLKVSDDKTDLGY